MAVHVNAEAICAGEGEPDFEILHAACVVPNGESIAQGILINVVMAQGKMFMECKNKDRKFEALVVPRAMRQSSRPLARTSIIEDLVALRDEIMASRLHTSVRALKERLSVRNFTRRKTKAEMEVHEGEMCTVEGPSMGNVAGRSMQVLLTKLSNPLLLELTSENLAYLRDVCSHQIAKGEVHNQQPRERIREEVRAPIDETTRGTYTLYGQQKVIARKRTQGSNKVKTKTFQFHHQVREDARKRRHG